MERPLSVEDVIMWLEGLSKGTICQEVETVSMEGLQVVLAQKGFLRCNFLVPDRLSDRDGNWYVGAMATLMDNLGAAVICSSVSHVKSTVELSISYYSTAKIQEEVEIEAKVVGEKEKATAAVVEIRRRSNGELIASGRQWMATGSNNRRELSKL
ncbi:Acyl-coenzyme A thioesterase 13 [Morella rubra]|uniref:Acyl-coenzyme A thioesterase 13 n=1 Tax=Morella rubra TaxID=262757 RepID=A0A6A1VZX7_9ROSI|nr:Acyl-coenzyme A thioesterase 13 [Morella rubra]